MPAFPSILTCRRFVERLLPADSPAAVLGFRHPLTRACGFHSAVTRPVGVVSTLAAVCGGAATVSGDRWAQSMALAACAVMPVLMVVLVLALRRVRSHVELMVPKGLETVPLTLVAPEGTRLLSPAARERVALRFETFVCERAPDAWPDSASRNRHRHLGSGPSVHGELSRVAELVRDQRQRAQGIAFAEAVLAQGNGDEALLRADLGRVIAMLSRS